MAAEHAELVGEMVSLEKMQMSERLKHAKKRRAQQLKTYCQYEKQLEKENGKRGRKLLGSSGSSGSTSSKGGAQTKLSSRLRFEESVLLLDAASRNDLDEVRNLLTAGVSPDVCNEDGLTALHQCSIDNLEEMMKLLVEYGADVSRRDSELWTPLHAAATCGHVRICRYLCEHGADLLAVNADGNMPYDLCEDVTTLDYIESEMARRGVTQELIDDTRLSTENQMLKELQQIAKDGGSLEYLGQNGETPLHVAACNGYIFVTDFLLSHHVSPDTRDRDEWQPLHCAACWGQLAIIEMLLENGADYEAKTKNGETTLDLCEDVEMKQRVLEIIEDVESKQPHKPRENLTPRRNSAARRGSAVTSLALRRSSIHEKTSIAQKEAQLEAMRLREPITFQEDDDEDETIIDAITLPQSKTGDAISVSDIVPTVIVTPADQKPEPSKDLKLVKPIISTKVSESAGTNRKANGTQNPSKHLPSESDIWLPSDGATKHVSNSSSSTLDAKSAATLPVSSKVPAPNEGVANSSEVPASANCAVNPPSSSRPASNSVDDRQSCTSSNATGNSKAKSVSPNGNSAPQPPSGTLAELKRQRAKRMSEALSVLTSGDSSLPNGSCFEPSRGSQLSVEEIYGNTSRRKYTNKRQSVQGSGKNSGCCLVM